MKSGSPRRAAHDQRRGGIVADETGRTWWRAVVDVAESTAAHDQLVLSAVQSAIVEMINIKPTGSAAATTYEVHSVNRHPRDRDRDGADDRRHRRPAVARQRRTHLDHQGPTVNRVIGKSGNRVIGLIG
jgi:hypothetical protein